MASVSVIINGDRDIFLTKKAVERLKTDAKTGQLKNASSYLKEGWTYSIDNSKMNEIHVNLLLDMFKKESMSHDEKHLKLSEKLKQMKQRRSSKTNHNLYAKQNVPENIYDAYTDACKKMPRVPFMNPVDVLRHPEKYQNDIKNIVESSTHLDNEYTTYYKALNSYFITKGAIDHAREDRKENVKQNDRKMAIFLQLHNMNQMNEWSNVIKTICNNLSNHMTVDLFITVLNTSDVTIVRETFKHVSLCAVDVFHNRGMDIGAFLWQIDKHIDMLSTVSYECVLKFHTKTHQNWRIAMVQPFLSHNLIEYIDDMKNRNLSWIGSKQVADHLESIEQTKTRTLEQEVFNRVSSQQEKEFVCGSIFLISFPVLLEIVTHPKLRLHIESCYTDTPIGRCENDWPHAFERFFLFYGNMKGLEHRYI